MTETQQEKRQHGSHKSRSAATRARLLDAAIASLYAHGYAATTTTVVAQTAGVSRGAMLHQFPSRVDLMIFVVQSVYEEELSIYHQKLWAFDDPRERLLALPEVAWEVLSRPQGVAALEIMQGARSDPELAARLRPIQIAIERDSFAAVDMVARQAGLVVPAMVKRLIVWSIRGLSIAEMLTDEPGEMIKSVRLLKRLFSYGLERADEAVNEGQSGHRDGFRVAVRIKDGT
jgi:AcrR family transcriptional regulator